MRQKLTKKEAGFAQVKNEVLNDPRISWKAKGLFAYLYSKPDNWDFSGDRITLNASDGRKSTYSGLKELEEFGYLTRSKRPNGQVEYHISWQPVDQKGQQGVEGGHDQKEHVEAVEPNDPNGQQATEPVAPLGTLPKRQLAETVNISNKEGAVTRKSSNTDSLRPAAALKKPSPHREFVAYWYDLTIRTRKIEKPIITGADGQNLKRVLELGIAPQTLEQLALYYLADPSFRDFAPDIKTFLSGGILNGLQNRMQNSEDFWKRLDGYTDRYFQERDPQPAREQRMKAMHEALATLRSNLSTKQPTHA